MLGRFDPVIGDALVPLPEFRLEERAVELLVDGEQALWVVIPAYDEAEGIAATLNSLAGQRDREFVTCVVDNGSRDGTLDVVRAWSRRHPSVPLCLVQEPEKGVGAAADTGFRVAIAAGARYVARTDADCLSEPDWTAELRRSLAGGLDFVIGRAVARRDQAPLRPGEETLLELLSRIAAFVARVRPSNHGPEYLTRYRLPVGSNLAIRGETYIAAGGFPRSRMEEVHEDRALMNRVRRVSARIGTNRRAVSATSIRRVRAYGLVGILRWYLDHGGRRGPIDVR